MREPGASSAGTRASRELMGRTLALYDRSPLADRVFVRIRASLSDLPAVERHAPRRGRILDLGSGHGLLTNLLALGSAEREVWGIDVDPRKVAAARRSIGSRGNVHFLVGDALAAGGGPYAAITAADVLYLLPPAEQRRLLAACHHLLEPDGLLLWKSQVRRPRWKYAITYGQEWLMTRLGPTHGRGLHFLDTDESLDALRDAGLRAVALPLRSWRPYTDVLFIGHGAGAKV